MASVNKSTGVSVRVRVIACVKQKDPLSMHS